LAYLDGLRALAAIYVVAFHVVLGFAPEQLPGFWRVLKRLCAFGHEAVAVFIVLSGYCLMLPVVRQGAGLDVALGSFVRRRAFRILPPYFAALAGSLLLLAVFPVLQTRSGTIWDDSLPGLETSAIVSHALLIHNWSRAVGYQINGPLWSVASEWQIYFFFPLLLLPIWRRWGMWGALVVAALVGYAPLLFVRGQAMVAIPWYLLLFTFGMAAAAIGFGTDDSSIRLRRVPWRLCCRVMWIGCVVFGVVAAPLWFQLKPLSDALIGLATATLLLSSTARVQTDSPGWLLRLLESRPLLALGHFSYSLYLTHLPVLALLFFWLRRFGWPQPHLTLMLLATGMTLSLLVAYVFHVAIERRFIVKR
jgi:peptidoglycan/LPS O-acetylase OafA/YrhL